MITRNVKKLVLIALLLGAYWFFGNLYEAIAMIPNHIFDPVTAVAGYKSYFIFSGPTFYFVPLTQFGFLALLLAWYGMQQADLKAVLARGAISMGAALVLTALIVTQIHERFFAIENATNGEMLRTLAVALFIANIGRLLLVGYAVNCMLAVYVSLGQSTAAQADVR